MLKTYALSWSIGRWKKRFDSLPPSTQLPPWSSKTSHIWKSRTRVFWCSDASLKMASWSCAISELVMSFSIGKIQKILRASQISTCTNWLRHCFRRLCRIPPSSAKIPKDCTRVTLPEWTIKNIQHAISRWLSFGLIRTRIEKDGSKLLVCD